MVACDRIQVVLEVEPTAVPIAGVAVGADGTSRTFCGWTALADAVAAAVDGAAVDGAVVDGAAVDGAVVDGDVDAAATEGNEDGLAVRGERGPGEERQQ